jgi:chaperone modulatory protein CbpM
MSNATLLQFLDEASEIALEELLAASGLVHEELIELVELGVLRPCEGSERNWRFSSHTIVLGRRAARLRNDFGLNATGMALALTYLERIEGLERRLRELECQLPR